MTAPPRPSRLPGDPDPKERIDRMIRVNQAGEFGAKRIYQGQLAVLGDSADAPLIREMMAQEEKHLERFNALVAARGVRPTVLEPLWNVAGFALGAATAALGPKAAHACTVAVEDVIGEHYAEQAEALAADPAHAGLKNTIAEFRDDELRHRAQCLAAGAEQAPAYPVLTGAVKTATKLAIWLSTRF
ncbi:MAG: demethoxyubiquinone hydroxylase family protein [Alphaproteobacteria bacterium]|nr:demethoxyubiquinone hydroxylase family protein [Alphaproteobacteria bacterium]